MNYRINSMSFIKADEAQRLVRKATQELIDEYLETILESLSNAIQKNAEEGYDELVYEVEEPRLNVSLIQYLEKQGYKVILNLEDEENNEHFVISWVNNE